MKIGFRIKLGALIFLYIIDIYVTVSCAVGTYLIQSRNTAFPQIYTNTRQNMLPRFIIEFKTAGFAKLIGQGCLLVIYSALESSLHTIVDKFMYTPFILEIKEFPQI